MKNRVFNAFDRKLGSIVETADTIFRFCIENFMLRKLSCSTETSQCNPICVSVYEFFIFIEIIRDFLTLNFHTLIS